MLVAVTNMEEFFRDALTKALMSTSHCVSERVQAYLVSLLSEFARSENAYAGVKHGDKQALALLLSEAQEAEKSQAMGKLKYLGDSSLYVTGLFSDSRERQFVGERYYIAMGENAYLAAANLAREVLASSSEVFDELSVRFADLVMVLQTMRQQVPSGSESDQQLLELLKYYKKTGDAEARQTLQKHGLISEYFFLNEGGIAKKKLVIQ